jgi:uncharacterized tellurite resistance protein B-like protein
MGTIAQIFESGEHSSKKGMFNNLVMLARVDGKVDDSEIELLGRIAKKLSLTAEQVKEIIEHPDEYPMIPPVTREERCERFVQFVNMMNVDGEISRSEVVLVAKYGIALGFTDEEVSTIEPAVIEAVVAGTSDDEIIKSIL